MAKVTVLNIPAHGHINPTLAVVQELVRRGEIVTYFATEPFRQVIEATGASFRAYRNGENLAPIVGRQNGLGTGAGIPSQPQADRAGKPFGINSFITYTLRAHVALIPELLDVFRSDMPDYIIYGNMCYAGRFAAQLLERPAIASFASLIQLTGLVQDRMRMTPLIATAEQTTGQAEYQQIQADLKHTYNIDAPEPFQLMQWPASLNIVYTSREFQAHSEQYDDRYVFVGPSIMQRPSPFAFPFDRLDDKPLIYISLGTIFNDRSDFYRLCIEAFHQSPYQVVMVLPSKIDPAELGNIPANFIVQPYVPQLELFPRISVFITHGGMSSVQEALSFGVPLVVFPQMIEQAATARRVAELGVGDVLSSEGLTSSSLRTTVEHIMTDPAFRQNSQKISASLKAAGGYQRAADAIQTFVQHYQSVTPKGNH